MTATYLLHDGSPGSHTASKKAGHNHLSPELFLEAAEMLLEGEPAKRLDSTPWIRRFVNNRARALGKEITEVKE